MSKIYYLKQCDELIGTITYPDCDFKKYKNYNGKLPIGLRYINSPDDYIPTKEHVLDFLKSRVVQEDNQGIDIIMKELKCPMYNLEVLLDNTFGMTTDDYLWLLPKDKLHWDFKTYHLRSNPKLWQSWVDDKGIHEPIGYQHLKYNSLGNDELCESNLFQ